MYILSPLQKDAFNPYPGAYFIKKGQWFSFVWACVRNLHTGCPKVTKVIDKRMCLWTVINNPKDSTCEVTYWHFWEFADQGPVLLRGWYHNISIKITIITIDNQEAVFEPFGPIRSRISCQRPPSLFACLSLCFLFASTHDCLIYCLRIRITITKVIPRTRVFKPICQAPISSNPVKAMVKGQ